MTNYHLKPPVPQEPVQPQESEFTHELRRKVEQGKAKRKAVLTRVWEQRARAYRQLLNKQKK